MRSENLKQTCNKKNQLKMVFQSVAQPSSGFDSSDDEDTLENFTPLQVDWLDLSFTGCCAEVVGTSLLPGCKYKDVRRNLFSDLEYLKEQDVKHIVVLCSSSELIRYRVPRLLEECESAGFRVHHHPFNDGSTPSVEECLAIIHDLKRCIENGIRTVLHCYSGVGRSCVVAAVLMMTLDDGMTAELAIRKLRQLKGPGAIQTVKQYNFVNEFRELKRSYDVSCASSENKMEAEPRSASR